jgi:hypothetical protein
MLLSDKVVEEHQAGMLLKFVSWVGAGTIKTEDFNFRLKSVREVLGGKNEYLTVGQPQVTNQTRCCELHGLPAH